MNLNDQRTAKNVIFIYLLLSSYCSFFLIFRPSCLQNIKNQNFFALPNFHYAVQGLFELRYHFPELNI